MKIVCEDTLEKEGARLNQVDFIQFVVNFIEIIRDLKIYESCYVHLRI